jgi:predicted RNase H-like HicB family nuclease
VLTYKAAYWFDDPKWVVGQVLDFPCALTQGTDLDDARRMLQSALSDMAESFIMDGQPLPVPDPSASWRDDEGEPELVEPIHLLLQAASQVKVVPVHAA